MRLSLTNRAFKYSGRDTVKHREESCQSSEGGENTHRNTPPRRLTAALMNTNRKEEDGWSGTGGGGVKLKKGKKAGA